MAHRKNNPLDVSERQQSIRERRKAGGLVRKEYWITAQADQDEEAIKQRYGVDGVERIRRLIAWVFAKQRAEMESKHGSQA